MSLRLPRPSPARCARPGHRLPLRPRLLLRSKGDPMSPLLRRAPAARAACILIGVSLLAGLGAVRAEDWPQFLGPKRNGVSTETGLNLQWTKDGPPRVWSKKIGEGYSGPVIAG